MGTGVERKRKVMEQKSRFTKQMDIAQDQRRGGEARASSCAGREAAAHAVESSPEPSKTELPQISRVVLFDEQPSWSERSDQISMASSIGGAHKAGHGEDTRKVSRRSCF